MNRKKVMNLLNEIGALASKVKPQPTFVTIPEGAEEAITETLEKAVHDKILEIWDEINKEG